MLKICIGALVALSLAACSSTGGLTVQGQQVVGAVTASLGAATPILCSQVYKGVQATNCATDAGLVVSLSTAVAQGLAPVNTPAPAVK